MMRIISMKLLPLVKEIKLNEYSDKLMSQMVALYQPQTEDSEDQIKANINRFEQIRNSIAKKLKDNNPIISRVIPDELKQNNKVLDITQYKDYNTLVKILKASDTKSVDIYKQAIEYYKKANPYLEPRIIGNYVARFKQNLTDLEQKVKDKDEDALNNIPKELLKGDAYKSISNWRSLDTLEHMLDAVFPLENIGGGENTNDAESGGDKIYDKDGLEIYRGDEEHRCIRYSKGYSWCIGRSHYQYYRYQRETGQNRAFYFVFDRTKSKEDKYHVVVIHALENGTYKFTNATNSPGEQPDPSTSWEGLGKEFINNGGKDTWNKIKDLKSLFKFVNPNKEELRRLGFKGKKLTLEAFADLDHQDKIDWLRVNASDRNIITPEIVKSLPPFGEPSKNDLINYDRLFSIDELKPNVGLIKRYAVYRFTRYPGEPLPYGFIPYLEDKPELQQKYFDKFEKDYLTFDEIEKYFSNDILKTYIDTQIKNLDFLPNEVEKHLTPDQKRIYDIYSVSFSDKEYFGDVQNMDNEVKPPNRSVNISMISYDTLKNLDKDKYSKYVTLYKKLGSDLSNMDKYPSFFLGTPQMFIVNNQTYFIVPKTPGSIDHFRLIDVNLKVFIEDFQSATINKGNKTLEPQNGSIIVHGNNTVYLTDKDFDKVIFEINGAKKIQTLADFMKLQEKYESSQDLIKALQIRAGIIK